MPGVEQETKQTSTADEAVRKAEDVVSTMLSKGFILGKDALEKAKAFDEKVQLTSTATATVASIDNKLGLTEKLNIGTAVVNEKVREMDERFQVREKTKVALAAAEQKATEAGSVLMSNRYVLTGAAWVSSAYQKVAKAAEDVSQMTKEKLEKAEEEKREVTQREKMEMVTEYARLHLDSPKAPEDASVPLQSVDAKKLGST